MKHVVVDANVLISFFLTRHEGRRAAATELLSKAANGDFVVVLPQFIIFEAIHVFRSLYAVPLPEIARIVRAVITYPGVIVDDACPWTNVLDRWPEPIASIADAALVAVATANRYDAIATFDRDLVRQMSSANVISYW